jgi:hypothetical protein
MGADREAVKAAVKHAVAVKIDLAAVGRLQEAELARRVEPGHRADRLVLVLLDLPLELSDLVLQLTAGALERIVQSKAPLAMALIGPRRPVDMDLASIGQRKVNIDFMQSAGAVVAARPFDHHPAGGHSTEPLLKLCQVACDGLPHLGGSGHALEIDLDRCLHAEPVRSIDMNQGTACVSVGVDLDDVL